MGVNERGRLRNDLRVLDHHDVSGHEVGAGDPCQLVVGEVPRLYAEQHPDRLADDDGLAPVGVFGVHPLRSQELLCVLRVVVQDRGGQFDLFHALPVQLAHLRSDEPGEVVRSFPQDLRCALDHFLAFVEVLGVPRLEGVLGRGDGLLQGALEALAVCRAEQAPGGEVGEPIGQERALHFTARHGERRKLLLPGVEERLQVARHGAFQLPHALKTLVQGLTHYLGLVVQDPAALAYLVCSNA